MLQIKTLACSVIAQAIKDFLHEWKYKKTICDECYEFLSGKTEISQYWFDIAEVFPLGGTDAEMLRHLIAQKKCRVNICTGPAGKARHAKL